ncbi:MAG: tetratricopeptide repeat protein, partial [Xanthobacteraceae bacterium]|nr:tetratricopeptide repeat protein [Xanthobacteraceae bacterium]
MSGGVEGAAAGKSVEPAQSAIDDDILDAGIAQHQAGRWVEAEAAYRKVLAQQPDHPDALHLLGVLAQQAGRPELAVDLIGQAIRRNGRNQFYFCNLGLALRDLGKV